MDALFLAFGMPGLPELAIILVVALLIFGRRLPEVMRGLGGSVNEFKRGMNDALDQDTSEAPAPPTGKAGESDATAEKRIG